LFCIYDSLNSLFVNVGFRFEVNLINDRNDIVLHFNPRFDSHILVLNSGMSNIIR